MRLKENPMFTGIVEEMGTVAALTHGARSATITVSSRIVHADARLGDSIATHEATPTLLGQIAAVQHLLEVTEL